MPVAVNFLKKTLENCVGQELAIKRLFDYLEDLTHHPSQQESLIAFVEKWKSKLHPTSQKMMIVNCIRAWPPPCLSKAELRKQAPWKDYVCHYVPTFSKCTVNSQDSPEYQPLNFSELVELTFWEELYDTFGNRITSHIFEKCALLFEADEGLYLIVAYPKGMIHRMLMKYEGKRKLDYRSQDSTLARNPYELLPENNNKSSRINMRNDVFESSEKSNEQEIFVETPADQINEPPAKRQKIEAKDLNEIPLERWIKPTALILQKVIEHRTDVCSQYGQTCSKPSQGVTLTYILVKKDEDFQPRDKEFVVKQTCPVKTRNPKLPPFWNGLKLPPNLTEMTGCSRSVDVTVYTISETIARKFGIRVKPKKRQRKCKRSSNSIPDHDSVKDDNEIFATAIDHDPTQTLQVSQGNPQIRLAQENSNDDFSHGNGILQNSGAKSKPVRISSIEPHVSTVLLPISSCLYNRSAWSRWPRSHILPKAVEASNNDEVLALSIMLDSILKGRTCSSTAHHHLTKVLSEKFKTTETSEFSSSVLSVIRSHKKFTDIHKLFKNCMSYWRLKCLHKQQNRRVKKTFKRKCEDIADEENLNLQEDTGPQESTTPDSPEVVDLAKSTPSTNFSADSGGRDISNSLSGLALENSSSPSRSEVQVVMDTNVPKKAKISNSRKGTPIRPRNILKPNLIRKSSGDTAKKRTFKCLKRAIPYNCVMQSLKQIFHIMKLESLLGSARNIRGFFKFVRKAVILGGTRSSLHLGELMALLHPNDTPFAKVCDDDVATETFVSKMVHWLFTDYILVLLRMSLYITESNFSRLQLNFYLRESWTSATQKMKSTLLNKGALVLRSQPGSGSRRANAVLRYMPKRNHSLRSLLLMKKTAWSLSAYDMKMFKLMLHYVDAKINKSRMYIPATIQLTWRNFLMEWKEMDSPKLYFLRLDIRDAYPTVLSSELKNILLGAGGAKGSKMMLKQFLVFGSNNKKFIRQSVFDGSCRTNWHSGIHIRPSLLMDLQRDKEINTFRILDQVVTLICNASVIKLGKKVYEFSFGLPQGWGPSPILCSIYYGHLDSKLYLPYIESNGRLFLRVVDDYLFVTPYPQEIIDLTNLMKIGCRKYSIKLNEEKCITNVFVRSDVCTSNSTCDVVTFCGWNFCLTCGHVSRDLQKYHGQDFCSTVTFHIPENIKSPEHFIRVRGTLIMPARLKPILLDPTINCSRRILLTVYESSILLSFRFYAICRVLYPSLDAIKDPARATNLFASIKLCCTRVAAYVIRNCQFPAPVSVSQTPIKCEIACCGVLLDSLNIETGNMVSSPPTPSTCSSNRSNPPGVVTTPNLTPTRPISKDFLRHDVLLYTSLVGFRMKLLNHSEVFKDQILPRLNRLISKLGKKLGDKLCTSIKTTVGSKMPEQFNGILI